MREGGNVFLNARIRIYQRAFGDIGTLRALGLPDFAGGVFMAGESELRRTFFLLGSVIIIGALLYFARPVIILVTLAVLTTFILAPIVGRLERLGIPRLLASTIALVSVAVIVIAIGHILVQQLGFLASDIPAYKTQMTEKIADLRKAAHESWVADVADFVNNLNSPPEKIDPEKKDDAIATRVEIPVLQVIQTVAGTAAELLISAVIVLILSLLMLLRREDLRNRVIRLLGTGNRVTATRALDDASRRVSRFLFFQLLINIGFGIVVTIGLYFIGIPYPYVWGALAAILRYVPFFGGWIAAAFPLLVSLILPTWWSFFVTAGFFLVIELLQANLVEPLVFGQSIGVSGPGQVIAMLVWTLLWGPVGLILATPLTACLCVLGHHFPGLRFLSTLMGDGEIVDKSEAFYQRLLAGDLIEASILAEQYIKETSLTQLIDDMLMPALLSARVDYRSEELSEEERATITEGVRDVFFDLIASHDKHPAPPRDDIRPGHVMVIEFPFNDEMDDLAISMLKNLPFLSNIHWSSASLVNGNLDQSQSHDSVPDLIVISTSAKKNLGRIRGACVTVRKLFPEVGLLVCCWCVDSEAEAGAPRLQDAGASAVCTTFRLAQQVIETAAHLNDAVPTEAEMATH
jgi:predicted PurR-regulated permease PerM